MMSTVVVYLSYMSVQLISSLSLKNVRSHTSSNFLFEKNVNAIVGPNGSGKTTILEAIHSLLTGKNFKGSIPEMMRWGERVSLVELNLNNNKNESYRRLVVEEADNGFNKKRWNLDGEKTGRLPISKRLPVVMFEPDIGRMVTGSPERRRNYIDGIASQLSLSTAQAISRFERIIKQRNSLLKNISPQSQTKLELDQLFIWNTQLASLSEVIITARIDVIKSLQSKITKQYKKLGGSDDILLTYYTKVTPDPSLYASRLLQFLETSLTRDIVLGHTGYGPHRDDLEIRLSDQPARERASRGEIRTIVLALKLLEAELLKSEYQDRNILPVLLFDDVLSELDLNHQEQILAGFKNYQVFITTTDAHTLTPGTYTIALD